ncbi:MAG: hypothetical protein ABIK09_07115 [Pseudomonadota bacterium]
MTAPGTQGARGPTVPARARAWLGRRRDLLLALVALFLAWGLAEIAIGLGGWDLQLMYKLRYTVEGDFTYLNDVEIYRPSPDSERVYETIPGVRTTCVKCAHPAERKYESFPITINSFGFRGAEVDLEAADDVYRILVLGGSNTFGPSVADEDTYPAQMQAALDRIAPGRFLVLNAGLNAYVMSQKVRYLEVLTDRFRVDLVIIQDYNKGRRAFFYEDPGYGDHFRRNAELYQESLPWLFGVGGGLHHAMVRHSRFYRLAWGVLLRSLYVHRGDRCGPDIAPADCHEVSQTLNDLFQVEGDAISMRRFAEVMARVRIPTIVLLSLEGSCEGAASRVREDGSWGRHNGVSYARICLPEDLPEEELETWTHVHPPSHVYAWYADRIVEELVLPEARRVKGLLGSLDTVRE